MKRFWKAILFKSVLVSIAIFFGAVACGASPKEDLLTSAQNHLQGVRWGSLQRASAYVEPIYRAEWMQMHAADQNVSITDAQIIAIEPAENENEFYVTVALAYYRLPDLTIQQSNWKQIWKKEKNQWFIFKDEELKNAK